MRSRRTSAFPPHAIDEAIATIKKYLDLSEVGRDHLPGRDGHPVHIATVTRWVTKGVRASDGSRIRLRAVRFPSGWRTTLDWVHEFIEAITADRSGRPLTGQGQRTATRRVRELDRKDRELDEDGF
jgi:hypothetical protein